METTARSETSGRLRWPVLAGLVAIPVYGIPVGIWGLRAVRPKLLRNALSGAIMLGALSLVNMSLLGLSRMKGTAFPRFHPLFPEEFAASAASGH